MRRSKQEAAVTQQRIIEESAAAFRKNGVAGTGLSDLMAAAGLTDGVQGERRNRARLTECRDALQNHALVEGFVEARGCEGERRRGEHRHRCQLRPKLGETGALEK